MPFAREIPAAAQRRVLTVAGTDQRRSRRRRDDISVTVRTIRSTRKQRDSKTQNSNLMMISSNIGASQPLPPEQLHPDEQQPAPPITPPVPSAQLHPRRYPREPGVDHLKLVLDDREVGP